MNALNNGKLRSAFPLTVAKTIAGSYRLFPWNRNARLYYYSVCWLIATFYISRDDENAFVEELSRLRCDTEFHGKAFLFALCYLGKNETTAAREWKDAYDRCSEKEPRETAVLGYLFGDTGFTEEQAKEAAARYKNPGVKKLLASNGLLENGR